MTARRKPVIPDLRRLIGMNQSARPLAIVGALDKANQDTTALSDLAAGILAAVGPHRCHDCGDAITVTAAAGVAEFAEYHRWLGRHERCGELDEARDSLRAISDRHAATGQVRL